MVSATIGGRNDMPGPNEHTSRMISARQRVRSTAMDTTTPTAKALHSACSGRRGGYYNNLIATPVECANYLTNAGYASA